MLLDFKKAFDAVNHQILPDEVETSGLGSTTEAFTDNHLSSIKEFTKV